MNSFDFIGLLHLPLFMCISLTQNAITLMNADNKDIYPHLHVFNIATFWHDNKSTVRYRLDLSNGLNLQKVTLLRKYNHF